MYNLLGKLKEKSDLGIRLNEINMHKLDGINEKLDTIAKEMSKGMNVKVNFRVKQTRINEEHSLEHINDLMEAMLSSVSYAIRKDGYVMIRDKSKLCEVIESYGIKIYSFKFESKTINDIGICNFVYSYKDDNCDDNKKEFSLGIAAIYFSYEKK